MFGFHNEACLCWHGFVSRHQTLMNLFSRLLAIPDVLSGLETLFNIDRQRGLNDDVDDVTIATTDDGDDVGKLPEHSRKAETQDVGVRGVAEVERPSRRDALRAPGGERPAPGVAQGAGGERRKSQPGPTSAPAEIELAPGLARLVTGKISSKERHRSHEPTVHSTSITSLCCEV